MAGQPDDWRKGRKWADESAIQRAADFLHCEIRNARCNGVGGCALRAEEIVFLPSDGIVDQTITIRHWTSHFEYIKQLRIYSSSKVYSWQAAEMFGLRTGEFDKRSIMEKVCFCFRKTDPTEEAALVEGKVATRGFASHDHPLTNQLVTSIKP